MNAETKALVDKGDAWLERAESHPLADTEALFMASMATAYYHRANIAAREDTLARGRNAAEQLGERFKQARAAGVLPPGLAAAAAPPAIQQGGTA